MKSRLLPCLIVLLWGGLLCPEWAWAAEKTAETTEAVVLEDIQEDIGAIDDYLSELDNQLAATLDGFSLSDLWQQVRQGDFELNIGSILYFLADLFFSEVLANGSLMGQILLLAVICLVLTNLKEAFGQGEISLLSRSVVYLLLFALTIRSFSVVMASANQAVEMMSGFLYAVLPVLMTMLAAMGNLTTVSILHPAMLLVLSFLLGLMRKLIFPLIYFFAVLRMIGHISPKFNLDKLASLFKDVALGVMSICLTLFVAFLGVMGLASSSFDGMAFRTAKMASGIFIPVVGRTFADAMDSVLGTALVLKNAIGLVGVVVLVLICALPAVKILVQVFIFRLAAALIQPLGEEQLSEALYGLANAMLLLFGAVAACGLLFFFVLALTVGVGNLAMMIR